uniref:Amino acid transporter transmembrane domain-containing protein n=1 Tax=Oryza barthii TaxID=65489 RepID=A0A0D3GEH6_9ORYZ
MAHTSSQKHGNDDVDTGAEAAMDQLAGRSSSSPAPEKMRRRPEKSGTVWTATAHIVALLIGSSVLAVAWTFAQLGWVAGPAVVVALSVVTYYSSALLADCYRDDDPDHLGGSAVHGEYIAAVRSYLGSNYSLRQSNLPMHIARVKIRRGEARWWALQGASAALLVVAVGMGVASVRDMREVRGCGGADVRKEAVSAHGSLGGGSGDGKWEPKQRERWQRQRLGGRLAVRLSLARGCCDGGGLEGEQWSGGAQVGGAVVAAACGRTSGGSDGGGSGNQADLEMVQRRGGLGDRSDSAEARQHWIYRLRWCSASGKERTVVAVLLLILNGKDSGRRWWLSVSSKERTEAAALLLLAPNREDGDAVEGCGAVMLLLFDPNEEDDDEQRRGAHRPGRGKSSPSSIVV